MRRIRRAAKRVLMVFAALLLGVILAVVPTQFSPEQSAEALCVSSIDPKCQPGNIPILIEAGIIKTGVSGPGVAQTAASQAANGYLQSLAQIAFNSLGALGVGIAGFFTVLFGGEVKSDPVLSANGLTGLELQTDDEWVPSLTGPAGSQLSGDCYAYETPDITAATRPFAFDVKASCDPTIGIFYGARGQFLAGNPPPIEWTYSTSSTAMTVSRSAGVANFGGLEIWDMCASGHASGYTLSFRGNVQSNNAATAASLTVDRTDTGTCASAGGTPASWLGWVLHGRLFDVVNAPSNGTGVEYGAVLVGQLTGYDSPSVYEETNVTGELTLTVECKGPGADPYDVTATVPYSVVAGGTVSIPDLLCNPGDLAIGLDGTVTAPGQPEPIEIIPPEENQVLPEIVELLDLFPDCFGSDASPCVLALEKLVDGEWVTCGPGGQYCPTWAATPEPQLQAVYQCKFGAYVVDIRYCSAFRAPTVGLLPNTDENGDLIHPSAPVPPLTGFLQLYDPNGNPLTGLPGGAPGGETGGQTSECWPTGWGVLNPIAWVLQPIQCALEWAFVPRTTVITAHVSNMNAAWQSTPPAQIAAFIEELSEDVPALDGCAGPRLDMHLELAGMELDYDGYPLSACEAPRDQLALVARTISALSMYWAAIVAISRYLGATMNFPEFGKS